MSKVTFPENGWYYKDWQNDVYEVLGHVFYPEQEQNLIILKDKQRNESIIAVSLEKFRDFKRVTKPSKTENEDHDLILEFLDLENSTERLKFLQLHRSKMTDEFLKCACLSLDFVESKEDLEERYYDLCHYIKTLIKFENK